MGLIRRGSDGARRIYGAKSAIAPTPNFQMEFVGSPQFSVNINPVIGSGTTTVSNSANGTYVNSAGLIVQNTANNPRFDFDPVSLVCRGLLIEEARTNLAIRSSDYSQAVWNKTDVTITASAKVAPDGTNSGNLVTEGVAGTAGVQSNNFSFGAGNSLCREVFLARGNTDWILLTFYNSAVINGVRFWFNLGTGIVGSTATFGTGTAISISIQPYLNGWYRCVCTGTEDGVSTLGPILVNSASANLSIARVNNATYYVWGDDFQVGNFGSSHIPTAGTSVTRAADVISLASLGSYFNAAAGTMLLEFTPGQIGQQFGVFSFDDNTANQRIECFVDAAGAGNFTIVNGGVAQCALSNATLTKNVTAKIAVAWSANDFAMSVNGGTVQTDAAGTIPTVNQAHIGSNVAAQPINGWSRRNSYWNSRLQNATLQALSA